MATIKKIRFDVFELNIKAQNSTPVSSIFELPFERYNPIIKNGNPIILYEGINEHGRLLSGYLINNQMDGIPAAYDIKKKEIADLALNENQGLIHPKCFLFDKDINFLVFESGNIGISFNTFCEFFESANGVELESSIVLDPEKLRKYRRLDFFSSFEVKIAKVKNGTIFEDQMAVTDAINLSSETNCNKLLIKLQASKNKSLTKDKIREYIRFYSRYKESNEVQKLIVSGREEDDEKNTRIDLIKNRFKLEIETKLKRYNDITLVHSKIAQMISVYNENRPKLLAAYKDN